MGNILKAIIENKRREIAAMKHLIPTDRLRREAEASERVTMSMRQAILDSATGIIAEFKRRSPSRGEIHPNADVESIVTGYRDNGAAACSILTNTAFFGGSLCDLAVARNSVEIPLLRKDFIIDAYQLYQARIFGADAVLLIASILSREEIASLNDEAHRLGLETLLELHCEEEVGKVIEGVDMVGVNNRNLSSFVTELDTSNRMAAALPTEVVKVAESGLRSRMEVERLRVAGYNGFLIGETFMKEPDPGSALKRFLHDS